MPHLPDLEAWAIFAKVAEKGSFSAAAQELGLAKTTVSKAVTRLEDRMRTALLHRTTRALSLTESGKLALERATRILADGAAVEEDLLEDAALPRGLIKLACTTALGISKIAGTLPDFMARYPDVKVDFNLTDNDVDVVGEGYDIAIQIGDTPDSSLRISRLFSFHHMVLATPEFFDRHGRPSHPSELAAMPAVVASHVAWSNDWQFSCAGQPDCSVHVQGPLRVNNAGAAMPLVLAGQAVALCPTAYVWGLYKSGRLERVLSAWRTPARPVYMVTPPGRARPARVRVLMEYLKAHFAAEPWAEGIEN